MIKTFLLSSFSKALNYYLKLDSESPARLSKLNGKVATIEWLPLHFVFQCCFHQDSVSVQSKELLPANVKISGTPWQMMNLLMTDEHPLFSAGGITIKGEIETGQQILALFKEMEWDGEEYLSRFMGDIPAYHTANTAKKIKNWCESAKNSLSNHVNEYLHEESDLFPTKEALDDFFSDVDKLRMDIDRIEIKINQFLTGSL